MCDGVKVLEEQLHACRQNFFWSTLDKICLLHAMKNKFGPEAVETAAEDIAERTRNDWSFIAQELGSNTIEDLVKTLVEPQVGLGFEYTSEEAGNGVQLHVTRCPAYEMAKEFEKIRPDLGIMDWMFRLNCAADPYIVEGFNPKMGFKRTKTLMEGHDCCDHYYYMKDSSEE